MTGISMRHLIGVACVASALMSGPALAQTAAPLTAAPVARPALSASHMALAADVVKLSGLGGSVEVIIPQLIERAKSIFIKSRPELSGEISKSAAALQPEFDKATAEALLLAANAYGQRLSEAELQEIKTFYSSPVGKKYSDLQPQINDDLSRGLDDFALRMSERIVGLLREDMRKKGHTL